MYASYLVAKENASAVSTAANDRAKTMIESLHEKHQETDAYLLEKT